VSSAGADPELGNCGSGHFKGPLIKTRLEIHILVYQVYKTKKIFEKRPIRSAIINCGSAVNLVKSLQPVADEFQLKITQKKNKGRVTKRMI